MRRRFLKIEALVLSLALLLTLCACGGEAAAEEEPGAGLYACVGAEVEGQSLKPEEFSDGEISLELRPGGSGRLKLEGREDGRLRWTLEGETLTLTAGGQSMTGRLDGEELRLELPEEGPTLYFALTGEGAEPVEAEPPWPLGGWYGCWTVTQTEGSWGELRGRRWDCCASTALTGEGVVLLTLWDEGGSAAAPLGRIELLVDEDGRAEDRSGSFLGAELSPGAWSAGLEAEGLENLFLVTGRIEEEDRALEYRLVLRPWGQSWEDAAAARPELLPWSYESWYLPLIDAGQPMPERMEIS